MPNNKAKILIVDDEPIKRTIMDEELREAGYNVVAVSNPLEAEPYLSEKHFDIILTDLCMPGQDGLSFLREVKAKNPEQSVIVMTAYGTVETAVEAMKLGAFDYLQKPFSTEELIIKFDKLLKYEQLASENEALRQQLSLRKEETRLLGQSEAMTKILARIHAIAGTDTTVLVEGESGTGKELAARMIHETSFRALGPFVAVSCAVLPRELVEAELFGHEAGAFTGATKRRIGRFELAHGGTIFLDDVDDIPFEIQVKLLRVLQERTFERVGGENQIRVNLRVIAASKQSLSSLVAAGKFREDLYYRLNVVPITMPTMRERMEDIPILVNYFLGRLAIRLNRGKLTITSKAMAKLQNYSWPGNVRELEHFLERMVALSTRDELDEQDVPELVQLSDVETPVSVSLKGVNTVKLENVLYETEKRLILWAMDRSKGNLSHAADMLDIPRSTLQYKLNKFNKQETSSTLDH
ncbi:MAG TPA: sigma-54-dependent Fis family transcriptional regulator [bacterium]|nr:sigma-54-dependent Fis family transcriptional regulator [bacterium]